MRKVQLVLVLQIITSLFAINYLGHLAVRPQNEIFIPIGMAFAFLPILVGVFLLLMTLFPVERRDGAIYYDPKLIGWRIVRRFDNSWDNRIHWCKVNWTIMGVLAAITFVSSFILLVSMAGGRKSQPIEWFQLIEQFAIVVSVFAVGLSPIYAAILVHEKHKRTGKAMFFATALGYLAIVPIAMMVHYHHVPLLVAISRYAKFVGICTVEFAVLYGFVRALIGTIDWISETAFGVWAKNLCPTFEPIPTER